MSNTNHSSQEKTSPPGTQAVHNHTDAEQHIEVAVEPALDGPPDGGYGWVVVVSIVFMTAATWGLSATSDEQLVHC
jgi:hypothetical protein